VATLMWTFSSWPMRWIVSCHWIVFTLLDTFTSSSYQ